MTELEKLEHARTYITKLANGINPLDDSVVPDGDTLNNVRLSRCFFYVSDILRQVIENGGVNPPSKASALKKLPFEISPEALCSFGFTKAPMTVSEIAKRVNFLIDTDNIKELKYTSITSWLLSIGMLEEAVSDDGKNTKRPTEAGNSVGIFTERRSNMYHEYEAVIYNLEAQHFIIDNLDAIIKINNTKKSSVQ